MALLEPLPFPSFGPKKPLYTRKPLFFPRQPLSQAARSFACRMRPSREREKEREAGKPSKPKQKKTGEWEKQGSRKESNSSSTQKKGGKGMMRGPCCSACCFSQAFQAYCILQHFLQIASVLPRQASKGSRVPNLGLRVPNPRKHPVYTHLESVLWPTLDISAVNIVANPELILWPSSSKSLEIGYFRVSHRACQSVIAAARWYFGAAVSSNKRHLRTSLCIRKVQRLSHQEFCTDFCSLCLVIMLATWCSNVNRHTCNFDNLDIARRWNVFQAEAQRSHVRGVLPNQSCRGGHSGSAKPSCTTSYQTSLLCGEGMGLSEQLCYLCA